jgi:hypothetical protein
MPVGIQPNAGNLNQQAGQILLNVRNGLAALANFNAYLQDLGEAGLTAPPLSMSQSDAQQMLDTFGGCAALAGIAAGGEYPTDGSVPSLPHNFLSDIVPFLAGN